MLMILRFKFEFLLKVLNFLFVLFDDRIDLNYVNFFNFFQSDIIFQF